MRSWKGSVKRLQPCLGPPRRVFGPAQVGSRNLVSCLVTHGASWRARGRRNWSWPRGAGDVRVTSRQREPPPRAHQAHHIHCFLVTAPRRCQQRSDTDVRAADVLRPEHTPARPKTPPGTAPTSQASVTASSACKGDAEAALVLVAPRWHTQPQSSAKSSSKTPRSMGDYGGGGYGGGGGGGGYGGGGGGGGGGNVRPGDWECPQCRNNVRAPSPVYTPPAWRQQADVLRWQRCAAGLCLSAAN